MGQILTLLNGGSPDQNRAFFGRICELVKDKVGAALDENETILFQGCPLTEDYDLSYDQQMTDSILRRKTRGLFRHLKMASSFDNPEIGRTERFRIKIDFFFLEEFIDIKIYDMIFDEIQMQAPNTFELLCIYLPYEKKKKYQGFVPKEEDIFYILQPATAERPVTLYRGDAL